jgi:hypothetical protein
MDRTTDARHESQHDTPMTPTTTAPGDALTAQLDALRTALADAERRAAVAEAVAAERERMIQMQAMALRMLEAGTSKPGQATVTEHATTAPATPTESAVSKPEQPMVSNGDTAPDMAKGGPESARLWRRLLSRR